MLAGYRKRSRHVDHLAAIEARVKSAGGERYSTAEVRKALGIQVRLRAPPSARSPFPSAVSAVRGQVSVFNCSPARYQIEWATSFTRSVFQVQLSVFSFRGTINQCFASATSYLLLSSLPPAALAAENNIPFRPEMDLPAVSASQPVVRHLYLRKAICFRR